MNRNTQSRFTYFCAATALAFALPSNASAEEVTLKSPDGSVNMTGELIGIENGAYILESSLGNLRISSDNVSCFGTGCPETEKPSESLRIFGSEVVAEGLMPVLLSGYSGFHDAAEETETGRGPYEVITTLTGDQGFGDTLASFTVRASFVGDGFANLISETATIGVSSRRIAPSEARILRSAGAGSMIDPSNEHILATDSLVVILHPNNPVRELTIDQLRRIYSGEISNWVEVGGLDANIQVVQTLEAVRDASIFNQRLFGERQRGAPAFPRQVGDDAAVANIVNSDPNSIGVVSFAFQRGAKPATLVSECGIRMVPDAFSARTEEYAMQRFLYAYTRQDTIDQPAQDFLSFATSSDADQIVRKSGFIDLGVSRRAQFLDSPRAKQLLESTDDQFEANFMQQLLSQMPDYDRLSTTFRFRTGSQRLTPRGEVNLTRLIDYLQNQPAGTEILIVGFTDSVGAFTSNMELAEERAERVLQELQSTANGALAEIKMDAIGYGEIAPTACNTTDDGRAINRRVEVWIRNSVG